MSTLTDNPIPKPWIYEDYFCLLPSKLKDGRWVWLKKVALVYEIEVNHFMGMVEESFLVEMEDITKETLCDNRDVTSIKEIKNSANS